MIKNIEELKKERPDLVSDFENMTKEELLNQCYLECIDSINMEERVAFFMQELTSNMSNTNYTIESLKSLVNEKSENDIREFCRDLIQDNINDRGILIALKEYAGGNQ